MFTYDKHKFGNGHRDPDILGTVATGLRVSRTILVLESNPLKKVIWE
jgi:hypothetical protein